MGCRLRRVGDAKATPGPALLAQVMLHVYRNNRTLTESPYPALIKHMSLDGSFPLQYFYPYHIRVAVSFLRGARHTSPEHEPD